MTAKQDRVAIIGCGQIGATNIYSLLMGGFVEELILVGGECDRLMNEMAELRRAVPLAHPVSVSKGSYRDAARADVAVIAAGVSAKKRESARGLLRRNTVVVREIVAGLKRYGFDGILLVITNPVDILARVAFEESGLPANRVIGSGNNSSTARPVKTPRENAAMKTRSNALPVIGAAETATWCAAMTGDAPLVDFCTPDCPDFGRMLEALRHSAPPVKHSKESTPFSAGTCVNRICEAVLRDERVILPVSAMTGGQYGVSGVFLNLPCVIGRRGIEKIVELPLDENEKCGLLKTAANLKKTYESLPGGESSSLTAAMK